MGGNSDELGNCATQPDRFFFRALLYPCILQRRKKDINALWRNFFFASTAADGRKEEEGGSYGERERPSAITLVALSSNFPLPCITPTHLLLPPPLSSLPFPSLLSSWIESASLEFRIGLINKTRGVRGERKRKEEEEEKQCFLLPQGGGGPCQSVSQKWKKDCGISLSLSLPSTPSSPSFHTHPPSPNSPSLYGFCGGYLRRKKSSSKSRRWKIRTGRPQVPLPLPTRRKYTQMLKNTWEMEGVP